MVSPFVVSAPPTLLQPPPRLMYLLLMFLLMMILILPAPQPPKKRSFFAGDAPKAAIVSDKRKADQKTVDAALMKAVDAVPMLKAYLNSKFSLTNNDKPHKMQF